MKNKTGFTIVELLVSVAVISVLAVMIVVVINPTKKKAQAKDASRKSGIAQISGALASYFVQTDSYPAALSDLVPGELKGMIKNPSGSDFSYLAQSQSGTPCTTAGRDCQRAVLYEAYEYPNTVCPSGLAYWGWTSSSLRAGKICKEGDPGFDDLPVDD